MKWSPEAVAPQIRQASRRSRAHQTRCLSRFWSPHLANKRPGRGENGAPQPFLQSIRNNRRYGQRFEVVIKGFAYWDVAIFDPSAGGGNSDIAEIGGGWLSPKMLTQILQKLEEGELHILLKDEELRGFDKIDIANVKLGWTYRVDDIRSTAKEEETTARH